MVKEPRGAPRGSVTWSSGIAEEVPALLLHRRIHRAEAASPNEAGDVVEVTWAAPDESSAQDVAVRPSTATRRTVGRVRR